MIYLDNNVIKRLLTDTKYFKKFQRLLPKLVGSEQEFISSEYSFFEYYGLNKFKIKLPKELVSKYHMPKKQKGTKEQLAALMPELSNNIFTIGLKSIQENLLAKQEEILNHIERNDSHEDLSPESRSLKHKLFGDMLDALNADYPLFANNFALYLTWDLYCGLVIEGFKISDIRLAQLKLWSDFRNKEGLTFPVGKIIDDFQKIYIKIKLLKNSIFKNDGDKVDSEGITHVLLGYKNRKPGSALRRVIFITFDKRKHIKQRLRLGLGTIRLLEVSSEKHFANDLLANSIKIERLIGKACCIDKRGNAFIINASEFPEPRIED